MKLFPTTAPLLLAAGLLLSGRAQAQRSYNHWPARTPVRAAAPPPSAGQRGAEARARAAEARARQQVQQWR
ncbi:hypothetical protein [Hymenobacter sp. B81]|uniref:hypothetical protein n=1 Tax=Hymenobacter sp. B81 TaxID=3344878 RepID=UPI0037DCDA79